ncbi:MAG TPA: hypothetical protein VGN05_01465 [Parvibaculum sp.]
MQAKTNEQYWRDRYGMPPRVEERVISRSNPSPRRRRRGLAALLKHRPHRLFPHITPKKARFAFSSLLKVTALIVFSVWVAGSNSLLHPASEFVARPGGEAAINADKSVDDMDARLTKLAAAQETSLVALRGYLLTGSPGFKTEWAQAVAVGDAAQAAIDRDSKSWTDGQKLLQLSEMRKTTLALRNEERMLIGIIATPNQYPGLRLYREDVDPALMQALALLNELLQSTLTASGAPAAGHVGTLAEMRGNVRDLRQRLLTYLPSGDTMPPATLRASLDAFRKAPEMLGALRAEVTGQDRDRLTTLVALIRKSDGRLQQIFALKRSPRWDYADYAFKQKVLPLTEKILNTVEEWRTAG